MVKRNLRLDEYSMSERILHNCYVQKGFIHNGMIKLNSQNSKRFSHLQIDGIGQFVTQFGCIEFLQHTSGLSQFEYVFDVTDGRLDIHNR